MLVRRGSDEKSAVKVKAHFLLIVRVWSTLILFWSVLRLNQIFGVRRKSEPKKKRYSLRLAIFRFPSHSQHISMFAFPWRETMWTVKTSSLWISYVLSIRNGWDVRGTQRALSRWRCRNASERASIKILQRWSESWRWREERAKSENHDQRHPKHHRSPLLTLLDPFTKRRFFFLYGKWLTESAELKLSVRWMGNNMQRDGRNRNEIQKKSSS